MGNEDFLEKAVLEDRAAGPAATVMKEVSEVVQGWVEIVKRIEKGEELLKTLRRQEELLSRETIPAMLKQHGITAMSLENGLKLEIKEEVYVRIPVKDEVARREAIAWLFAHGGGTLVKDKVIVEDLSLELKQKIVEAGYSYEEKEDVNTNSLTAWAKDVLGIKKGSVQRIQPNEFPDSLGLFQYSEAKLKA